jgi:hypothetical protein
MVTVSTARQIFTVEIETRDVHGNLSRIERERVIPEYRVRRHAERAAVQEMLCGASSCTVSVFDNRDNCISIVRRRKTIS